MKIIKFGHCCLLIEEKGLRILTDPGIFSTGQDEIKNIDIILITHDHKDHFHIDSLKKLLKNNVGAKIITNKSVGELLKKEKISFTLVENGQSFSERGFMFEGFGKYHAVIHKSIPVVENAGYFIGGRLFYPGDAFTNPGKKVEILALPVAGPWMKLSEAIDYAIEINPKICFPVHDSVLSSVGLETVNRIIPQILEPSGIEFKVLEKDKETEI